MLLLLALAVVSLMVAEVTPQCPISADDISVGDKLEVQIYKGQTKFSLEMMRHVNSLQPQTNIFFSPLSIYSTLLLAYFISTNHTEKSLHKALFLPSGASKVDVIRAYKAERLIEQARANDEAESSQLINANRLFVSKAVPVQDCMQQLFSDEIETLDFISNANAATDHINNWIANMTKNNIDQLLAPGQLNPATKLVLANAAFFKGQWNSKFLTTDSKKETFFVTTTKKSHVIMMRQKGYFKHLVSETMGAHVLALPYKGNTVTMFVFLPPFISTQGVNSILKKLTIKNLQNILSEESMIHREVVVGLPKFTVEQSLELVPILSSLGVGDLFNSSADLSGLTGTPGISLDEALHKAKIQVDEEGTTAAGATAFFDFRSARPLDVPQFICNHPFVYLLYDSRSKTILFTGTFSTPPPIE